MPNLLVDPDKSMKSPQSPNIMYFIFISSNAQLFVPLMSAIWQRRISLGVAVCLQLTDKNHRLQYIFNKHQTCFLFKITHIDMQYCK